MTLKYNARFEAEMLRTVEMQRALQEAAEVVEANVKAQNIRVEDEPGDLALPVEVYNDDRDGSAVVALAHPSGDAVQAKHGTLTKAAVQAGLDLR